MTTDELISELRDQAEVLGAGTECHVLREAADAIECLDERVAIMSEPHGWIRVEDRKPAMTRGDHYEDPLGNEVTFKSSENVLLYLESGDYVLGRVWEGCFVDWYGTYLTEKVTHWMPLPEAPKEGNDGTACED